MPNQTRRIRVEKDFAKFPREVARLLTTLINEHGVRHRMPDGGHVLLYGGDSPRPKKISASREAEQSVRYLHTWAATHVATYREKENR